MTKLESTSDDPGLPETKGFPGHRMSKLKTRTIPGKPASVGHLSELELIVIASGMLLMVMMMVVMMMVVVLVWW